VRGRKVATAQTVATGLAIRNAGMTVEQWLDTLGELERALHHQGQLAMTKMNPLLVQLEGYYEHLQALARGYEKNPDKLAEQLQVIQSWRDEINQLIALLEG
jgi:hypothetical protein